MKALPLALAVLLGDASSRTPPVDLSRFDLLRSFGPWEPSGLSPGGRFLTVTSANAVALVDLREEREVRALGGHPEGVHDTGWSRDGRVFATSGYDGVVRVWEVATGRQLARVEGHDGFA